MGLQVSDTVRCSSPLHGPHLVAVSTLMTFRLHGHRLLVVVVVQAAQEPSRRASQFWEDIAMYLGALFTFPYTNPYQNTRERRPVSNPPAYELYDRPYGGLVIAWAATQGPQETPHRMFSTISQERPRRKISTILQEGIENDVFMLALRSEILSSGLLARSSLHMLPPRSRGLSHEGAAASVTQHYVARGRRRL